MSEVGISSIAYYLPEARIDNLARTSEFDIKESFIHQKIGMTKLARKNEQEDASSLAIKSVERLFAQTNTQPCDIDCLIVVTQNPDGYGLPHVSAIVHGQLDLAQNCAAFDISLGCSGYVYGLSVIKAFMQSNGLMKGILVTADPYSKVIDMQDKNTSLLFGDAATATLLEAGGRWTIGQCDFGTEGRQQDALFVDEAHKLKMNGRSIFSFSAQEVPKSIKKALEINKVLLEDIDQVILHQGSRYIVDTIAGRISAEEKTPFVAAEYGNTVSSSIPLYLAKDNVLDNNDRLLISGFGVGLSWATTVLTRMN